MVIVERLIAKARGYGDGPPREDDSPRKRYVIVLPRMFHLPKIEGMKDGPSHSPSTTFMFFF
ncbi:hypothetical protein HanRHA438_Chr11g0512291 [Helianthus annuus]|nr:hypothetical protein HanIR_Chr11g0537841 [Helianthus annuus]KAJ0871430.1 hypothetical protein HanRHA438_Chr11g0512291 [Helianthus annuus]